MASRCSVALRALARPSHVSRRALSTSSRSLADAAPAAASPRISAIVDEISGLTLLQAMDLVTLLKTRLNIQEVAMSSGPAPVAAAAAVEDAPVEEAVKEKTIFNVKLESFEAGSKPKIIREVKALVPNLTLIDAKKFVEALPKVLKENMPKEDAEKLKELFEKLGAVVKLE